MEEMSLASNHCEVEVEGGAPPGLHQRDEPRALAGLFRQTSKTYKIKHLAVGKI
jgi:hypothetical protein